MNSTRRQFLATLAAAPIAAALPVEPVDRVAGIVTTYPDIMYTFGDIQRESWLPWPVKELSLGEFEAMFPPHGTVIDHAHAYGFYDPHLSPERLPR